MSEALVKLSTNSWHFKLQQFVYGEHAARPERMFNLCPYFWMVIAAMILLFPVLPFKLLGVLFRAIDKYLVWPLLDSLEENITDKQAVEFYNRYYGKKGTPKAYIPLGGRRRYGTDANGVCHKFLNKWAKKKYGVDHWRGGESYSFLRACSIEQYNEYWEKKDAREEKQARKEPNFLNRWGDAISGAFDNIVKYVLDQNTLIKITKRFIGLIMTTILFAATFFVVGYTGRAVVWIIDVWNWQLFWTIILAFGISAGIIGTLVALGYIIQWMKKQYEDRGRKLWFVEFLKYTIYWPFRIVFYSVIWRFVCVWLIAGIAVALWKTAVEIFKSFGKYFAPAYGDYCPGIEWDV